MCLSGSRVIRRRGPTHDAAGALPWPRAGARMGTGECTEGKMSRNGRHTVTRTRKTPEDPRSPLAARSGRSGSGTRAGEQRPVAGGALRDHGAAAQQPGSGGTLAPVEGDLSTDVRVDGRRRHVIERALDYAGLARQELTDTQIARRRRKSRGYVSILRRLGQALSGLPEDEVRAFQSPRIGFALVQRLVRDDVPVAELRAQLRYAMSGVSLHNLGGRLRRQRSGRDLVGTAGRARSDARGAVAAPRIAADDVAGASRSGDGAAPVAESAGRLAGRQTGAAAVVGTVGGWGWDAALFADDPESYVRDYVARLRGMHEFIAKRADRDVRARTAVELATGQSIRRLTEMLEAHRAPALGGGDPLGASEAESRALAALRLLGVGLDQAIRDALTVLVPEARAADAEVAEPGATGVEAQGKPHAHARSSTLRPRGPVTPAGVAASAPGRRVPAPARGSLEPEELELARAEALEELRD